MFETYKALALQILLSLLATLPVSQIEAAQIAFFKEYRPNGSPVIFEGLYSHIAVKYEGYWLHAHPYHGVTLTEDLRILGRNYIILENSNYPEPSLEFVDSQLMMTFDLLADWNDPLKTYCSKLGGQYLNIKPSKMTFRSHAWRGTKALQHRGKPGLSPSDVYWYARRNLRFKTVQPSAHTSSLSPARSCESYLQH